MRLAIGGDVALDRGELGAVRLASLKYPVSASATAGACPTFCVTWVSSGTNYSTSVAAWVTAHATITWASPSTTSCAL